MARIRLLWRNAFSQAILTASSEALYFEASNLQLPSHLDYWTTGSTLATETIEADLGQEVDITALAIFHKDLQAGDTVTFQGYAGGWVDVTPIAVTPRVCLVFLDPFITFSRVRFSIAKAGGAGTTRSISKIFVGQHYEFPRNPSRDSIEWSPETRTAVSRSREGVLLPEVGATFKTFGCTISAAPPAMSTEMEALTAALGVHAPFTMVFDADAEDPTEETLYGTLKEPVGNRGRKGVLGYRSIAFRMVEAL